jgi:hypothetical protein
VTTADDTWTENVHVLPFASGQTTFTDGTSGTVASHPLELQDAVTKLPSCMVVVLRVRLLTTCAPLTVAAASKSSNIAKFAFFIDVSFPKEVRQPDLSFAN